MSQMKQRTIADWSAMSTWIKWGNRNQEYTFPTNSIGIRTDGTAETKPNSKYSNSVNLCQLPNLHFQCQVHLLDINKINEHYNPSIQTKTYLKVSL